MSTSMGRTRGGQARRAQVVGAVMLAVGGLLPTTGYALRIPDVEPARRVQAYVQWNMQYLYLAARVPDTIITGTSAQPMSTPEQDDAVEFDLRQPTGQAHRLILSAAEGMTMLTRDAQGNWRSDNAWIRGPRTIKYAVKVTGTLNKPQDTDTSFVVECAIPWEFLGGMPAQTVQTFGFNVINWMQGDNEGIVGWSPYITSGEEAGDTARWGKMVVTRTASIAVAEGAAIPCPFNPVEPFIDGELSADEWMMASTLSFDKPEPQWQPAAPEVVRASNFQALMAIYRYDWSPAAFRKDGAPTTIDQPKEGAGPWYSAQRVDWHRAQLNEVKRAGIDVIMVHYQGDAAARRTWACTGLDRLTQALKERRSEGLSYPLVGLYLDTSGLQGADLRTALGKQQLTGMIRDFFQHVPREFRAEVGAQPAKGLRGGVPVLLGEPTVLADWDESFPAAVEHSLGQRITWLGSTAWEEKGVTALYAHVRLTRAGLTQDLEGRAPAFTISPGYCPPPGTAGDIRPRRDGRAYRTDWQRIIGAAPALIVINSWNDFTCGTEIAPSRQYGFQYVDATRAARAQLGYGQSQRLRLLQHSVPEVMAPGREYQVELLLANDGTADVVTGSLITTDYRITRRGDGQVMYLRTNAQSLRVLAGQIRRVPVVITTKNQEGKPLPPGDYVFSLVVMRTRVPMFRSKFIARPIAELSVPFAIGAPPPYRGTIISTSLPSTIPQGATENVTVRVRNDGAEPWRTKGVTIAAQWVVPSPGGAGAAPMAAGEPAALPQQVDPGEAVSVVVPVRATPAAVPTSSAEGPAGSYQLAWSLMREDGHSAALGEEAISLPLQDPGVAFVSAAPPQTVAAGSKFEAPVTVGNGSTQLWAAAATKLTAQWYRWDGEPLGLPQEVARLDSDLASSMKANLTAALTAPAVAGAYWVAWQMNGSSQGRWPDLLVSPIAVTGGKYRALDLSSLANCIGIVTDTYRPRGDFDGSGRSFPAECLPPDQSGADGGAYPEGYYAPAGAATEEAVPFVYPVIDTGMGAVVACTGQTVSLGDPGARVVHLLAASATEAQSLGARAMLADGSTVDLAPVSVPPWQERVEGVRLGAYAPYVRTLSGDEPRPAYLYDVALRADSGQVMTSLVLPENPRIRIVAITVEQ